MLQSFVPIVGVDTKVLILGSMPGNRSLQESEYYAYPQNSFWWIMSQLVGFSLTLSYQEKCSQIQLSHYSVWDVLRSCQREGSLDNSIVRSSEQVNDFSVFLSQHKNIKLIAFNGGAARQIFMRHCSQTLNQYKHIKLTQLPSSSPADARLSRQEKLRLWRDRLAVN